jgi:hypothetical protein
MSAARRDRAPPLLQHPPLSLRLRQGFQQLAPVVAVRHRKRLREADAFLLSFPKTGRTWLRVMIAQLLAAHFDQPEIATRALEPRIEGGPGVPRIVVRHDGNPHKATADEICPHREEYRGCRVMLLVRDPRDAIVSNYFQVTRRDHWYEGDLASYLRWPRGSIDSMLRYYEVWARNRSAAAAMLLLRYEDLRHDTPAELRRVAGFLGLRGVTDAVVTQAVEAGSFDAMRRREAARAADASPLASGEAGDPESFKVRKGRVGGYRDYLTAGQVAWLDARVAGMDAWYGYGLQVSDTRSTGW